MFSLLDSARVTFTVGEDSYFLPPPPLLDKILNDFGTNHDFKRAQGVEMTVPDSSNAFTPSVGPPELAAAFPGRLGNEALPVNSSQGWC